MAMMEMVQPREWTSANGSGTEWVRIGKAWMKDDGTGALEFSALPLPTLKDGKLETRVLLRHPMPKDGAPARSAAPRESAGGGYRRPPADPFDDDMSVPF